MPRDLDISGLYSRAINLWVEDPLVSEYLQMVWGSPPDLLTLIGGGNQGVRAVVEDARQSGFSNVFGLVDGDFRPSNRTNWLDESKGFQVFALSAHEVENHLLDADALANCDFNNVRGGVGRTAAEIEVEMRTKAEELTWWMSCREVLSGLSHLLRDDFPEHPKIPKVTSRAEAETHILTSTWHTKLRARMTEATKSNVRKRLAEAKKRADRQLESGEWRLRFSGKEIFHHIRSWIHHSSERRAKLAELDIDVAKAVARWQFDHNKVPAEIRDLLVALRQRVVIH